MGRSGAWQCAVAGVVLGLLAGPLVNLAKNKMKTPVNDIA